MRLLLLASTLALGVASAAAAQDGAPPGATSGSGEDVVVVGKNNRADQRQEVRNFVRALDNLTGTDPIARFDQDSSCPAVIGLNGPRNAAIVERMRRVAKAVGIPVSDSGCKPNVLVIIARNKDETIKALRQKQPIFFRDAAGRPISVPKDKGPATAWQLSGLVDRRGTPVAVDPLAHRYVLDTPEGASLINSAARPVVHGSVLVMNVDALVGLTMTQIADYAAMRAFAPTQPRKLKDSGASTILTILDAPADSMVPLTLTQWDQAYLRALYATGAYHNAYSQRADMARRISNSLEHPHVGQPDREAN